MTMTPSKATDILSILAGVTACVCIINVVAAMAALAGMGYYTNISVAANGYPTTLLWQDSMTLLLLLPTLLFTNIPRKDLHWKKLYPFMLLGVTGFLYTVAATLAYAHNLALSSVIVSLPVSMLFAYMLSKRYGKFLEQHPPRVYAIRFSGAFIMVGCAIWLSFL